VSEPTALGIDLGTTLSVVAQVNHAGLPTVLPNAEGSPTTPSVVLFDRGTAVVGSVARESLATEPELVVQLVKRQMGSSWTFDYQGIGYGAEHVSALILRKLLADARLLAGLARRSRSESGHGRLRSSANVGTPPSAERRLG
jgi:molecular chaperone DnaK